jgi:hypothetical protein
MYLCGSKTKASEFVIAETVQNNSTTAKKLFENNWKSTSIRKLQLGFGLMAHDSRLKESVLC